MNELKGIKEEKDDNGDGGMLSSLFFLRSQETIKKVAKKNDKRKIRCHFLSSYHYFVEIKIS
ncbi:hypothetical protein [Ruminococcus albus]|uniref:hypothetical protein n=1 Tax=Ruminococcus albus TaxID=1264 RepID=UPI000944B7AD|nr:hypothetical protein [Ruminococcus albus]